MSLINRMLQDLDSRHATSGKASGLHDDVRPLPAARGVRWPLWLGAALGLFALAGGAWFAQEIRLAPVQAPAPSVALAMVPETAAPVPLPVPVSEPASELPPPPVPAVAPVAPAPLPEAVQAPAPQPARPASSGERVPKLRLTTDLRLPADAESASPRSAPPPSVQAQSPSPSQPLAPAAGVAALPPPATEKPVPRSAASPVIEKTPVAGSPRERAESDYRKAIGVLNQGRTQEAVDLLQHALRIDAEHGASRQLLFKLLHEARRTDEAAQLLREGLQVQPAQIAWAMSLARLQVDRGDFNGAWHTLQASLPAAGSSADYHGFAAHVLQRLGRHKEAAARYETAARLAPGDGRWWLGLGLALESDGRPAEARDAFAHARASGTLSADLLAIVEQKLR